MIRIKTFVPILEAILCSFGFMAFAYFVHDTFPTILISFVALLLSATVISFCIRNRADIKTHWGEFKFNYRHFLFATIGLQLGLLIAFRYRYEIGIGILPDSIRRFAITAAIIGMMEELVFRGFIQGHLRTIHPLFAILFATMAHTAYKSCLFLSPAAQQHIDIHFLIWWTLAGGLLFGILREYSKSIVPAVLAHSVFDIVAYGSCMVAPWWVW